MKRKFFFMILSIFLVSGCAHIKTRDDVLLQAQKIKEVSLQKGIEVKQQEIKKLPEFEELTYKAKYLGMTIGTMTASIKMKVNGA